MLASAEPLVEHVTAVLRVRPYLAGPASLVHGAGPCGAHQHLGTLHLVERAVRRLVLDDDRATLAADDHGERLALEPRDRDDAGYLQQERHVLAVVDLVEEGLFAGLDVHRRAEEIPALDRHGDDLLY